MANITFSHTRGSARADHARNALSALLRRYADYRLYRNTYAELSALSDRELDDLGIGRGNLEQIARESVYGV